jgi:hypothetical protein
MPRTLASAESGALRPPISVRTHPGAAASTVIRRPPGLAAKLRASEFNAALLAR